MAASTLGLPCHTQLVQYSFIRWTSAHESLLESITLGKVCPLMKHEASTDCQLAQQVYALAARFSNDSKITIVHACNMKEFKVYVGTSEDNMSLVLNASLKNDTIPETFSIPHTNDDGVEIPTRYVKLAPVSYATTPSLTLHPADTLL